MLAFCQDTLSIHPLSAFELAAPCPPAHLPRFLCSCKAGLPPGVARSARAPWPRGQPAATVSGVPSSLLPPQGVWQSVQTEGSPAPHASPVPLECLMVRLCQGYSLFMGILPASFPEDGKLLENSVSVQLHTVSTTCLACLWDSVRVC